MKFAQYLARLHHVDPHEFDGAAWLALVEADQRAAKNPAYRTDRALFAVVKSRCLDEIRKLIGRRRHQWPQNRLVPLTYDAPAQEPSDAETLFAQAARVRAQLDALNKREAFVVLEILKDKTQHEIARALGISEGRVSQIRASAVKTLRARLGKTA